MAPLLLTGEPNEGGLPVVGEDREELPLAWALLELDGAPMVPCTTLEVLDFGLQRT